MGRHLQARGTRGAAPLCFMTPAQRADFIRANTEILPVPLTPEIRLHLAHESLPIWMKTEEELGEIGLPPPFWAFAWAGGQALARHVLDHPEIVRSRRVVDLASGSGLVAIAAMKAGAASALAADIDLFAAAAMPLNAALNDVSLAVTVDDLLATPPPLTDVILVGDLFYEQGLAARCYDWLRAAQAQGAKVLIGDPGRSYLPKDRLVQVTNYAVPVSRDLEDAEIKKTAVWRLQA
jgi:predicted nicotinamide N-methyase